MINLHKRICNHDWKIEPATVGTPVEQCLDIRDGDVLWYVVGWGQKCKSCNKTRGYSIPGINKFNDVPKDFKEHIKQYEKFKYNLGLL
tara:strand:- start:246 stop:509 length:264 start_codon:yes stop_codon:yes gene_type:complete